MRALSQNYTIKGLLNSSWFCSCCMWFKLILIQHLFFSFYCTGVWTQGLVFGGRCLITWEMPLALFWFRVTFQVAACVFAWVRLGLQSSTYTSTLTYYAQIVFWDGVSLTFFLGWPRTRILPISALWVAGIIGVSHCNQPRFSILTMWFLFSVSFKERDHFLSLFTQEP
jgi:hypothetical protein